MTKQEFVAAIYKRSYQEGCCGMCKHPYLTFSIKQNVLNMDNSCKCVKALPSKLEIPDIKIILDIYLDSGNGHIENIAKFIEETNNEQTNT